MLIIRNSNRRSSAETHCLNHREKKNIDFPWNGGSFLCAGLYVSRKTRKSRGDGGLIILVPDMPVDLLRKALWECVNNPDYQGEEDGAPRYIYRILCCCAEDDSRDSYVFWVNPEDKPYAELYCRFINWARQNHR